MPAPVGIVFTNRSFGPSLSVGQVLDVTASSGLSGVSKVNFTGASATPVVLSDTHLTVVVPLRAVVGPVTFTKPDGTYDSGYTTFYPWIRGDWHTQFPTTTARSLTTINWDYQADGYHAYWDLAKDDPTSDHQYSRDVGLSVLVGAASFSGATINDVMTHNDEDPGEGSDDGGTEIELVRTPDFGSGWLPWAVFHSGAVLDLNLEYQSDTGPPYYPNDQSTPPHYANPPAAPTTLVHPGDPWEWEDEGIFGSARIFDWSTWVSEWEIAVTITGSATGYLYSDIPFGTATLQVRVVPVDVFPYNDLTHPSQSPVQGTWWTSAQLAGFRVAHEFTVDSSLVSAPASFTVALVNDEIRFDQINGTHAMLVFCVKEAVEEDESFPENTRVSASAEVTGITYHFTPPRYRYLTPQYGVVQPVDFPMLAQARAAGTLATGLGRAGS